METNGNGKCREYWMNELERDRLEMREIDAELRMNTREVEKYKIQLNLIGRDLMFASVNGVNVDEEYSLLQNLRERCW